MEDWKNLTSQALVLLFTYTEQNLCSLRFDISLIRKNGLKNQQEEKIIQEICELIRGISQQIEAVENKLEKIKNDQDLNEAKAVFVDLQNLRIVLNWARRNLMNVESAGDYRHIHSYALVDGT